MRGHNNEEKKQEYQSQATSNLLLRFAAFFSRSRPAAPAPSTSVTEAPNLPGPVVMSRSMANRRNSR